jgi:pimeloyl-ACP methyl ester carboxylesterase
MKNHFLLLLFLGFMPNCITAQADTSTTIERASPLRFEVQKNGKTYTLRYASNHPIAEKNKKIERLIVYIHGARRNGLDYFEWGHQAVKNAKMDDNTLLISPQFTSERDLNNHKHDNQHLFWANNSWRSGDNSASSKNRQMSDEFSSFSLVDSMILKVCDKKLFPKLKKVVVIGHSAGGQFLQRYAGMTPIPEILRGYKFRFIVMNSSSYLYLDDRRPQKIGDKLSFIRPTDTTTCKDFNTFPKGFDKPNSYLATVGAANFKKQFLERDIVFLMGGNDVDMNDTSLDKSCSGNLQGRFRLERGQFFYTYIQTFAQKGTLHRFAIVPNVAHSGEKMVADSVTRPFLFDK